MRRLGIGVIGVGSMGTNHVAAFSSLGDARVVHVMDAAPERAAEVAARYGVPRSSGRLDEIVADDAVDAIVVATPEADHLEPTIASLEAGKHVLLEKPLATTLAEAELIRRTAARAQRYLMVGHNLRFEPRYSLVKDVLDRGELGAVVSVAVRRNRPRGLFELYSRTHPAFETGVHDVDLLLWYIGRRVRRVHAAHRSITKKANPDGFWALLEFEEGGIALMESVWLIPDEAHVFRGDALELIGTRGTAHVDISDPGVRFWTTVGQKLVDPVLDPQGFLGISSALRSEVAYFTRCVLEGRTPDRVSLDDAVHGVEVIEAIIRAATTGADTEVPFRRIDG